MSQEAVTPAHFIRKIVTQDVESKHTGKVITRFPPEPNGFLHIGHAKSICLNFGLAEEFGGDCHLRFDDTNPAKEEQAYVESIKADVEWLGFKWAGSVRYASDYFDTLYDYALHLIDNGNAYVCELSADEAREYRGTLKEPGKNSPYRDRSPEENRQLFEKMRAGEFEDGAAVLRAKIDMAAPNINLRDPILYRVRRLNHHQTGDTWCIYPTYDFTHGQSDAIEGVTHSLCTLEFEDHRPLYEWLIEHLPVPAQPRQYEFARLNLNYTVTSKRKLKQLVDDGHVEGWDDPRMPTISGMRRRGYTPLSLRNFCERIGVTRSEGVVDMSMLEHAVREDLDATAPRAMCVLNPIRVVLENYPENDVQTLSLPRHPKDESMGQREVTMSRELYIDRNDFEVEPPPKWKRLFLNGEVRLRGSYVIHCHDVVKDEAGNVVELRCTYDENTLGKNPEGRKVKGVIHWVSAADSVEAEVRLYDRLFQEENPAAQEDFTASLNLESLTVLRGARAEASLRRANVGDRFQFEREGYFAVDSSSSDDRVVFNRTVSLRDSWQKVKGKG
ncbi:glutaminyl-tRNA synthetase [gamma proteobacterium HTCC5015]|nr:glutaminyl-tRNA synthetase [gamma proteobacterium HTCC5015]